MPRAKTGCFVGKAASSPSLLQIQEMRQCQCSLAVYLSRILYIRSVYDPSLHESVSVSQYAIDAENFRYLSQPVEQRKAGSRVTFYDSTGRLVNGTVQSITRTSDGAQLVLIKRDSGGTVTLPSASVFQA
ncbi:hypothetical protein IW261DRAFT_1424185 [Armillaria novae-zelandiae]|uniref:Uncharacterized protein n=1 Tax=Armillaria novae-zelandiae TaxID=153914 RepID=A0AA39NVT9_9AGAR|nr:hypothetical protein IW261DRAFT_1424185 [Armillaria novae-zelandiae]